LKPIVTIGLCVRNEEKNVGDAVESVLDQNFPHELMEVITVDGCSKDGTIEIIEKVLSREDIVHKIFLENEGLGHARQTVVKNAKGKYIIWVDGSIRLSRSYTKRQVDFMERNPKIGIVSGKHGLCLGSVVAILENLTYIVDSYRWKNGEKHQRLLPTGGSVFRNKAIRGVGGFDKHIIGACEDIELAHRMKMKGWLFNITDAVFYEKCEETWKGLWDQYSWWGYGAHYLFHKDGLTNLVYGLFLPAGPVIGLIRGSISYRLTLRRISFLLPIHYTFKKMAWSYGFIKSHLDGYGHNIS
jgi:glycosyltransferase involved in cell wall biosynthesis